MSSEPKKTLTRDDYSRKLAWMRALDFGWDSYVAAPPSGVALSTALQYCEAAEAVGLPITRVAPSSVGGVAIFHGPLTDRTEPRCEVFIEIYNSGMGILLRDFPNGSMVTTRHDVLDAAAIELFTSPAKRHLESRGRHDGQTDEELPPHADL